MKKKIILCLTIIISAFLLGYIGVIAAQNSTSYWFSEFINHSQGDEKNDVIATVNDVVIYQHTVDAYKDLYRIQRAAFESSVSNSTTNNSADTLLEEALELPSDQEVLDVLIRNKVLEQEAARKGITISEQELLSIAQNQYALLKEAAQSDNISDSVLNNYLFILAYQREMGWTEEEYIQQSLTAYKAVIIRQMLYQNFASSYIGESIDEAFTNYTNNLVSQATITLVTKEHATE